MEKAGGIVRTDQALSALWAIDVLSQAVQLLGGKMVSTGYDEVVLEIEGFVLAADEQLRNLVGGDQPPRRPILFHPQASCTAVGRPVPAC